jgi:Zn-dependent protease with chaperone function
LTAAVLFALYAAAAAIVAPPMLRGPWAAHSPRLAIALWLVLPVSWVAAVVLAILAATTPFTLTWTGSPHAGTRSMLAGQVVPGGQATAAAGLLLAAAVALRAAGCVTWELHRGRRARREHAAMVAATGRPGHEPGVALLDHDAPAVYCMPRGRYRIVISSGALAALTPEQLDAVLAHERAHLRFRHHLGVALATALARAFPRVPLLTQAQSQLAVLAEMAADDTAARRHRPEDLAAALVILANASARPATLAASGPEAMARLQRILATQQPRKGIATLAAIAGLIPATAIACLPLILAACDATSHL